MTPNILVGLDESPSSRAALAWAARYATLTRSVLRAVHVVDWPYGLDESAVAFPETAGLLLTHDEIETLYRHRITRIFDEIHPRPDWLIQFAQGQPGPVLVRQARHARLLVVGTREHIGLERLLVGSISHYCLSHAACPVVAVPAKNPLLPHSAAAAAGATSPRHGVRQRLTAEVDPTSRPRSRRTADQGWLAAG